MHAPGPAGTRGARFEGSTGRPGFLGDARNSLDCRRRAPNPAGPGIPGLSPWSLGVPGRAGPCREMLPRNGTREFPAGNRTGTALPAEEPEVFPCLRGSRQPPI